MFNPYLSSTLIKALKTLTIIAFLGSTPTVTEALAQNVNIYRGVNANANSGNASTSPGQFSFTGVPAILSTFDTVGGAPVAKPCLFVFTVTGVAHNPAQVGDTGNIVGLAGYTVTYDNNPAGHWGITHPGGITPVAARAAVSAFASTHANRVIVNGTLNNCQ